MSTLFKKTKTEHIFVLVICLFVVIYFIFKFYKHLDSKGKSGSENTEQQCHHNMVIAINNKPERQVV